MPSSKCAFRIRDDLKAPLEAIARRLNKKENWIINEALREYLDRNDPDWLRAEAHRQSLIASKKKWKDEAIWEQAYVEVLNNTP
jgi:predicted transcriptional regulator